jgi:hypothetical protein
VEFCVWSFVCGVLCVEFCVWSFVCGVLCVEKSVEFRFVMCVCVRVCACVCVQNVEAKTSQCPSCSPSSWCSPRCPPCWRRP